MHALCKLPFGKSTLTSKKGRLASDALKRHREAWSSTIAAFLDEVSIVSGDQLTDGRAYSPGEGRQSF